MARSAPTVTFSARGHPALRVTHAKTVELTSGEDVTGRATCVLGVGAQLPADALQAFRGPVVVTLRAGEHSERITATANPRYSSRDRLVVRRSDYRCEDTFATGADKAAADIDRELAAALADPTTELTVEVAPAEAPPLASAELLVLRHPGWGRAAEAEVARELARVSVAWEVDEGAGDPVMEAGAAGRGPQAAERARAGLERGEAVAILGDPAQDESAAALLREAADAGVPVRTVAEPDARVAALLATGRTGARSAFLGAPPARRAERGRQVAALAALGVVAVWQGNARELAQMLEEVAAHLADAPCGVLLAPGAPEERALRGGAEELTATVATADGRRDGVLVVDLGEAADSSGLGEGQLAPLLSALLAEGVSSRTLAAAVQQLPGMSRRRAYDLVLAVKGDSEAEGH